jgi:hypothetical protein
VRPDTWIQANPAPQTNPSRHINAEDIKPIVWDDVIALLADPDQLLAQFDRFAAAAVAGSAREQAAEQLLRARLERTARADKRLLDACQAGAVSLSELTQRRQHPCPWLHRSGDAGDLGPNLKGLAPGGSILGGEHLMAAKMEEVVDPVMGRKPAVRRG